MWWSVLNTRSAAGVKLTIASRFEGGDSEREAVGKIFGGKAGRWELSVNTSFRGEVPCRGQWSE